jgi:hypothetical protein
MAAHITALVKQAAMDTNLVAQGYVLHRIETPLITSVWLYGSQIPGSDDSLIMKIGQWMGLTFLTYIHSQNGALNTGLAQQMTTRIRFVTNGHHM